jgi:hypothetical protein
LSKATASNARQNVIANAGDEYIFPNIGYVIASPLLRDEEASGARNATASAAERPPVVSEEVPIFLMEDIQ